VLGILSVRGENPDLGVIVLGREQRGRQMVNPQTDFDRLPLFDNNLFLLINNRFASIAIARHFALDSVALIIVSKVACSF